MSSYFLKPSDLPIDDKCYKPDLEISDRFQAYSSELLRMSLAGIIVVGFFYEKLSSVFDVKNQFAGDFQVRDILFVSLICLAISSAAAIAHRSLSSDSMFYHLTYIRYERAAECEINEANRKKGLEKKANTNRTKRNKNFWFCKYLLYISAFALGAGTICLVVSFGYGIK